MSCTHSSGGCSCSHDHDHEVTTPGRARDEAPAAAHSCCGGHQDQQTPTGESAQPGR